MMDKLKSLIDSLKSLGESAKKLLLFLVLPVTFVIGVIIKLWSKNADLKQQIDLDKIAKDLNENTIKAKQLEQQGQDLESDYRRTRDAYLAANSSSGSKDARLSDSHNQGGSDNSGKK